MSQRSCRAFGYVLTLALASASASASVLAGVARRADAATNPASTTATSRAASADTEAHAKLIQEANTRLLAASRKNQCAFRPNSDVLLPGCERKLKSLAEAVLTAKKKLNRAGVSTAVFQVFGHTGSAGLPDFNREISERRASTIARELVGLGVLPTEILSFGLASSKPLVTPDDTPAKQAKNQRYEIQVKL